MADWIKLKNEYISTGISQRKLAEKYKVSFDTLKHRANKEKWADEKRIQRDRIAQKTQQKAAEKIADAQSDRILDILGLTDELAPEIKKAIGQLETAVLNDGSVIDTGIVDTYKLRQIVQSIKDLKEIVKDDSSAAAQTGVIILPEIEISKEYKD